MTGLGGFYTLEEAIQWMRDNQERYAAADSKIKCIGIHLKMEDKECQVFCLDYRYQPSKHLNNDWHYRVSCFSNHYLLPLNSMPWNYHIEEDYTALDEELLYTPETAKYLAYTFIELDQIEGTNARQLILQAVPQLQEYDQKMDEIEFLSQTISTLNELNFPDLDEPF